jgi:hypothetical protein
MILGTFHFPQAPKFNNIMAAEQQAEIQAVVDSLADFQPNKIVLEETAMKPVWLDSLYDAYRAGRHDLPPDESQQLGFRLAATLGHRQVYAIDYKQDWPMDEAMAYAKEHDSSFVRYYRGWQNQIGAEMKRRHRRASVGSILRWLNDPKVFSRIQEARMRTLEVGADSTRVGVKPVASIYERNMHIFAHLTRVAEPGDRIVVIYGVGHKSPLQPFVRRHPNMTVVDPLDYL